MLCTDMHSRKLSIAVYMRILCSMFHVPNLPLYKRIPNVTNETILYHFKFSQSIVSISKTELVYSTNAEFKRTNSLIHFSFKHISYWSVVFVTIFFPHRLAPFTILPVLQNLLSIFSSWWLNHPSEKYSRQIGSSPQVGMNIKNI